MTDRLRRRRVLITGALGAIGSAALRELRYNGAEVCGLDSRAGPDVIACDITDPVAVETAVAEAVTRMGGIDALINCAGIATPVDAGTAPDRLAREVVEWNLWGQWHVTAAAMEHLMVSRGRVVFVASALARMSVPFGSAYAVSKRALTAYADTLRIEYGSHVKVSTVYPGYADPAIQAASGAAGISASVLARPERIDDVVDTVIGCLTARRPARDIATTGSGRWQLWAARQWPRLMDRARMRRVEGAAAAAPSRPARLSYGLWRRHRLARLVPARELPQIESRSHTVTTSDGIDLDVTIHGPLEAAVSVVYLHGWCLSSRIWRYQPEAMARSGSQARLITMDLRGHGGSGHGSDGSMTIDRLADDLKDVLEQLSPDRPAVVVGHSMGGMTIMALAERHPELLGERVAGAVLVNTTAEGMRGAQFGLPNALARMLHGFVGVEFPRRHRARLRRGDGPARKRMSDLAVARYVLFGRGVSRADVRLGRELIATTHPAALSEYYRQLRRHDRAHILPTLDSVPTEILSTTRDRLTPLRHSRAMAEAMPKARLTILPDSGHTIPLERPDELAERVASLVARVSPRG